LGNTLVELQKNILALDVRKTKNFKMARVKEFLQHVKNEKECFFKYFS